MAERTLKISIVGEDRGGSVRRTFREVENDGNRLARGFTSVRASVGGNMRSTLGIVTKTTGAIVASFAAVKVVGFLKGAIDEAREAEKVGRITEARIKSTGGAANVSAKQFDTLTTSISNQVGVDDELIAAGGNMLLTFKGVRNEVGKGNDIFDQATRLAVDLAAGMNEGTVTAGGLRTANIQLGKALEDPIRGITALRRAGVSFTEQQKDQIKKLVESGKTLEAQKLIIKAVGEQFAGTAKAAADPWERLGVVWGNVKEKVGNLLLPALSSAATFVSDKLIPAAERWWQKHGPEVRDSFSKIAHTVGTFFRGLKDNLEPQLKRIKDAWDDNKASLDLLVGSFGDGTDASKDGAKAAKSFGDAVVATTEFVGRASRFLDQAADKVNGFEQSMSKLGKNIHKIFVRPMLDAVNMVVQFSLGGWARIADGAATLIEHMPGGKKSGAARTLREGADQLRSFAAGANRALHSIDDETTKITAKFGFQGLEVFRVGPRGQTRLAAAGGGPIRGPGTGTSDSIPAWLSHGEHVWTADEVDKAGGHGVMEAWRSQVRGFAIGGDVRASVAVPPLSAVRAPMARYDRGIEKILALATRAFANTAKASMFALTGGSGAGFGSGSWMRAIAELRREGVPYNIISTFRAGARTRASGSVSFHSLNRAVDLTGPNMLRIWQALTDTGPTELIYSRAPLYKSRRGWNPIGQLDPITRADHYSHVHAAYRKGGQVFDNGGTLAPGLNLIANRTGRPEPLFPAGGGTITVNINMAGAIVMGSEREVANRLEPAARAALKAALRREGKQLAEQL